jgi:hypothetical protein
MYFHLFLSGNYIYARCSLNYLKKYFNLHEELICDHVINMFHHFNVEEMERRGKHRLILSPFFLFIGLVKYGAR